MKLCVLTDRLDSEPLYSKEGLYLYYITINEYKKYILKGIVERSDIIIRRLYFVYARDILKDRFELGEDIISKNAWYSCNYSISVLKGRFELGESAICTSGYNSHRYALYAQKNNFHIDIEIITKATHYRDEYRKMFNSGNDILKENKLLSMIHKPHNNNTKKP